MLMYCRMDVSIAVSSVVSIPGMLSVSYTATLHILNTICLTVVSVLFAFYWQREGTRK